ncbi:MAG TPA: hypothetical protein VMR70_09500 [Flavisolibacter sp.]|nr:hypothetical protein [Flavisolibacter sp.]
MNRIFHPSANTLLFRMSDTAEHYKNDTGKFYVSSPSGKSRSYHNLLEAFLYYIAIDDEAELWDGKANLLVEKKVKVCLN